MKVFNKLLFCSLTMGGLFSLLFYRKEPGISMPIFTALIFIFMLYVLKQGKSLKPSWQWLLCLPVFILASTFFYSVSPVFRLLNLILIILLITALSILLCGQKVKWDNLRFLGYIISFIFLPFKYLSKPFKFVIHKVQIRAFKYPLLNRILAGLAIALPLLSLLIYLLRSADMVFSETLSMAALKIQKLFSCITLFDTSMVIIITIAAGSYAFAYIWNTMVVFRKSSKEQTISKNTGFSLDPVIMATVLSIINAVYVLFCILQFSYLFGGTDTLPFGITYSEYARRGFFELLAVSMINFVLIASALKLMTPGKSSKFGYNKLMLIIMGAATYVMLGSSFYRMRLYEVNYGYTYLRIFVYFFLLLESILLLATMAYIIRQSFNIVKLYIITSLVLYTGLNTINIDGLIAEKNINRYFENPSQSIDLEYLKSLSLDAVPQMVRLLDSKDRNMRESVKLYIEKLKVSTGEEKSWQEFNWSYFRAQKILSDIR